MNWMLDKKRPDGSFPFEYRSSANTDVRATFERIRREQQAPQNVRPINQPKRKA